MLLLQFRKIAKHANLRAILLGIMGAVSFLFPVFLISGMVYVIAAYAILNRLLGVMDFISNKGEEKIIAYLNVIAAGLAVICGILCIVYFRYLVNLLPFFFGTLLMIEGLVHFIAAVCSKNKLRSLLIVIALAITFGGAATILFTFGFGGLLMLSRLFGSVFLLCCVSELFIYLIYKKDCQT